MSRRLLDLLLHGVLALAVSVTALWAYDRWIAGPRWLVGVVDLNSVYRQKEAEFTRLITEARSEEDRARALQSAAEFAQRLPLALESLPQECRCLVMLNTAVVSPAPHTQDLTPKLRSKLELR